jgi:hypothetical protein
LSLHAVGTIDSFPYNPVDHATMRSPLNRPGVDGGSDSWKGSEHAKTPQVPT